MPFLSDAGIGARVAEPVAAAAHDSEEDWSMDQESPHRSRMMLVIMQIN